jgi:hypothetical protein
MCGVHTIQDYFAWPRGTCVMAAATAKVLAQIEASSLKKR